MEELFNCYAAAAFGMEGLVSKELKSLGLRDAAADNGGVRFSATAEQLFLANMRMHFSDRLFIVLREEACTSFAQLFDLVYAIDWPAFFSGNESIDISCRCVRSTLMSQRDCQSITKKAVIEKIRKATKQSVFPESGPSLPVHLSVRNDRVMILLNSSGDALSRRGYRTWNGEAPLRETLAAALVELSGWRPGRPLYDPCCGTGTLLAEAALMAAGRAPGVSRKFAMEDCVRFRSVPFSVLRAETAAQADMTRIVNIGGSDIDPSALELASRHFRQAGIPQGAVPLRNIPLQDLQVDQANGLFICNPPYGERLSDQKQCRALYHDLFLLRQRHPGWGLCAISSDPAFERSFGKKAARKRRLYNGRLECVFYCYD